VSSFLTAHQHKIGHSVPYVVVFVQLHYHVSAMIHTSCMIHQSISIAVELQILPFIHQDVQAVSTTMFYGAKRLHCRISRRIKKKPARYC